MREAFYKKRGIFVCDMAELFGDWIPEEWQRQIFEVIKYNWWHRFYLLTKQPQNLPQWSPFPDNCWVGVSVTTKAQLRPAIWKLSDIQCNKRFLSFEPLLEPMLEQILPAEWDDAIDWVIIGGQSGKDKFYPPEEWIQEIENACDKLRIPIFEKDNLRKVWSNTPRQEMPMGG
jgi:protein gp37